MTEFKLSDKVNPNKVFILKTSEIEKRLDPFYYIPEIKELEKKVRQKDIKPLRFFVENISSGATPKTAEKEKYYSDKDNGIPFLRVQNLSPTGILEYEDCKYINKETHNGYLKRSQVEEGDLLVKITGVGRMAVASVAPDNFIGNTNQHMVVIKTGNKEVSTILASYLNSDIGEKLASRRATGGTRPALDYPALLSIPILYDKRILEITTKAVEEKNSKQKEAKQLLDSIDDYLLNELGITLPKKDNSLENRIFTTSLNKISGRRFDSFYNQLYFNSINESITNSKYNSVNLKNVLSNIFKGTEVGSKEYITDGIPFVRVADISNFNVNTENANKRISNNLYESLKDNFNPKVGDILFSKDGTIGFCTVVENEERYIISSGIIRLITNNLINKYFLSYLLATKLYKSISERESIGTVIMHLNMTDWLNIKIPLPSLEKQTEIANHITTIRNKAQQLELEAKQIIVSAKAKVEHIILGE